MWKRWLEPVVVILAVLLFPAPVPHEAWWLVWAALAWSGLVGLTVAARWPVATRITTLSGLGMVVRLSVPRLWPGLVPLVVSFAIAAILGRRFRTLRPLTKLPRGSLDRDVRWMVAAVVVVAAAGIATWVAAAGPDAYSEGTRLAVRQARAQPIWIVAPVGVLFAVANAGAEEAFFRGAFMGGLTDSVGLSAALPIQALSFGLLHLGGFPSGFVGVVLAAAYGVMLGLLRIRARGLLAPWMAHALADLAIISVIVWVAR
jgi:hypothetical protein